ncbi:MAG: FHA domain-containing protein, partial [Myxococcota bacterium]|nr:FHA domain-containing protein [Myxococcota bacterium]
ENDVVIDHRSISRNHVKVVWREGSFTVIDLASANGILVNGNATSTTTLVNGDIVEMGHVKLRFSAAGDAYQVTMADIDDVTLPPKMSALRVIMLTGVVALVGLAAYVVTNASSQSTATGKTSMRGAQVIEPSVPALVTDDAEATQVVVPSTEGRAEEVLSLLVEGERYMDEQKWDEALAIFTRILQTHPDHPLAVKRLRMVEREKLNRRAYQAIKAQIVSKDWVAARAACETFDQRSGYYGSVTRLDRTILAGMRTDVQSAYQSGMTAYADQRPAVLNEAIAALEEMEKAGYPLAGEKASKLMTRRQKLRAKRPPNRLSRAANRREKKAPVETPTRRQNGRSSAPVAAVKKTASPTEAKPARSVASYDDLLKNARKLMYGAKHKEAETAAEIERLLKAAINRAPGRPNAYLRMCIVHERAGRYAKALTYCEQAINRSSGAQRKRAEAYTKGIRKKLNP